MDPRLHGVQPVNQPRPKPIKTKKQEAQKRHQKPATDVHAKQFTNEFFGLGIIDSELIDRQILLGKGAWHPSNIDKIPLTQLKADVLLLKEFRGTKPTPPTPYQVLKAYRDSNGNIPTPFQFYKEKGGTDEYSSMNNIDLTSFDVAINTVDRDKAVLEGKKVPEPTPDPVLDTSHTAAQARPKTSLTNLASAIVRNTVERNIYYEDRAAAYIAYFQWLSTALQTSQEMGVSYNKRLIKWEHQDKLYTGMLELTKQQQAWDNSLTDIHKREIMRQELSEEQESRIQNIIDKRVKEAVDKLSFLDVPKRGRPKGSLNKPKVIIPEGEIKG